MSRETEAQKAKRLVQSPGYRTARTQSCRDLSGTTWKVLVVNNSGTGRSALWKAQDICRAWGQGERGSWSPKGQGRAGQGKEKAAGRLRVTTQGCVLLAAWSGPLTSIKTCSPAAGRVGGRCGRSGPFFPRTCLLPRPSPSPDLCAGSWAMCFGDAAQSWTDPRVFLCQAASTNPPSHPARDTGPWAPLSTHGPRATQSHSAPRGTTVRGHDGESRGKEGGPGTSGARGGWGIHAAGLGL